MAKRERERGDIGRERERANERGDHDREKNTKTLITISTVRCLSCLPALHADRFTLHLNSESTHKMLRNLQELKRAQIFVGLHCSRADSISKSGALWSLHCQTFASAWLPQSDCCLELIMFSLQDLLLKTRLHHVLWMRRMQLTMTGLS